MRVGDKDIDEGKLAMIIEDHLSDLRFDKFNFAHHMGNKSPRIQREFWELVWAFIEQMADYHRRGLVDTKHYVVAQVCYEIVQYVNGVESENQLELEF